MKKNILIIFLLLVVSFSFAQSVKINGVVTDNNGKPLELANVIAFKKGTNQLEAYSISDAKGNYKLVVTPNQNYTLKISYLGYKSKNIDITAKPSSSEINQNITLEEANETMNEVQITYEMPVKIIGDTIVYNADSFTSGKEKKLGDVLKKLPGVEVDDNGEVQVEGKTVQKVLVEGKKFFDGDSKIATQNIPASAIDKVQILKNYNEVAGMKSVSNNEDDIAINIKLKQGKEHFWFGEIKAGAGDPEKYEINPKLFYYSPKKSVNLLANFNNISDPPFTMRDYFRFTGGLRSGAKNSGTNFNVSSEDLGFMTLQNNKAQVIISKFGALNFSLAPNKKIDYNGFVIVNQSETNILTNTITNYNNSNLIDNSTNTALQINKLALAKFGVVYNPNLNLHIDYSVFGKLAEQTENATVNSTQRSAETYKKEVPLSLNQNFNVYYTLNAKNIFSAELQHFYSTDKPLFNSIAMEQPFVIIPTSAQNLFNLIQNEKVSTNKFDAKLDYYYLLNAKSNINFTFGTTLSGQKLTSGITQNLDDGTSQNFTDVLLNNNVHYNFSDVFVGLHYKMVSGIFTFNPGLTVHNYSTEDTQLGSNYKTNMFKVLPDVYARLQFNSAESLRFNYGITSQFSDINNIAEGYILSNYNALTKGNRLLENALYHSYSLSYFSFSMFNFTNINASVNYTKKVNGIKNTTQLIGVDRISYPINSNLADATLSANFRYQKTYRKLKTSFKGSISNAQYNNTVNNVIIQSHALSQSYQASLASNFKNAPNFEVGYQKSFSNYSNTNSTTDKPFANIEIGFLKNFIFTADYSYYNYKNKDNTVKNNYSFLNADLYFQKKNSKWEFKLSANNLTNATSINTDSYNEISNSNVTSLYFVQPRIYMFSIKYNL